MPRLRFQTKALLGYLAVALVLAIGMTFSVHQLTSTVDAELAGLRAKETEISRVERLRWNSEVIVSDGRGFLLTGDPALLDALETALRRFDASVDELGSRADPWVARVVDAADRFIREQQALVEIRRRPDGRDLILRFERELLPLRVQLDAALADLVEHRRAALDETYRRSRADRAQLEGQLFALRGLLLLVGLVMAWYFASRLGRSYRVERDAKDVARTAVATRDEVMGVVAHDLRNPLGAITMTASLLATETELDKAHQRARSIERIATRMEFLIRTMLDVTSLDAGTFTIQPAPCALDDLVRETQVLFEPLARGKQITLDLRPSAPGLVVRADRERVLQVISNLIGNALKFTPRGGRITVGHERDGEEVRFTVADTGPGIPPDLQARVFDRLWMRGTSGAKGTGLGLFIAKGIVEAHGGRIWVESVAGAGARFFFTLPLIPARLPTARTT